MDAHSSRSGQNGSWNRNWEGFALALKLTYNIFRIKICNNRIYRRSSISVRPKSLSPEWNVNWFCKIAFYIHVYMYFYFGMVEICFFQTYANGSSAVIAVYWYVCMYVAETEVSFLSWMLNQSPNSSPIFQVIFTEPLIKTLGNYSLSYQNPQPHANVIGEECTWAKHCNKFTSSKQSRKYLGCSGMWYK